MGNRSFVQSPCWSVLETQSVTLPMIGTTGIWSEFDCKDRNIARSGMEILSKDKDIKS